MDIITTKKVCATYACERKITLHYFISSGLQKEKQAVDVPDDSSKCKRLLPTFRRGIGVLKQENDVKRQTTIPLL